MAWVRVVASAVASTAADSCHVGPQLRNFEAELEIFRMQPSSDSKRFRELVGFLSHVAPCYPKRMAEFPGQLMTLLRDHYSVLRPELRRTLVQCTMLLRNRNMVDAVPMLKLFFEVRSRV